MCFKKSKDTFVKSFYTSFQENYGDPCEVSALDLILYVVRELHCV